MSSFFASGCLLAVFFGTGSALAAPAKLGAARLALRDETSAKQCLDAPALERAVDVRLRRHAFRADSPVTLYVEVVLTKAPQIGWQAQISVRDAAHALLGSRSIASSAAHCSSLDDSLALVVALLVDAPPAPPPAPASSTPTSTETATPAEASATPISLPPDTHAPREPWQLGLRAGGALVVGALPGAAPGVEAGLELAPPRAPTIQLFGKTFFTRRANRADRAAGADFSASAFVLELCPIALQSGALSWAACGGQAVGWVRAKSFGFDVNTSSSHLSYALVASSFLDCSLTRSFALRLEARAELPVTRDSFDYGARNGSEPTLYEMSPIAASLDVGFLARL